MALPVQARRPLLGPVEEPASEAVAAGGGQHRPLDVDLVEVPDLGLALQPGERDRLPIRG